MTSIAMSYQGRETDLKYEVETAETQFVDRQSIESNSEIFTEMRASLALLPEPPSEFSVDADLAGELLKLSFKERSKLEEEIHGVRCGDEIETPQLVEESLSKFDSIVNAKKENDQVHVLRNIVRISLLGENEAQAAKSQCYLNDPDVRLRFLRCEQFDVDQAVERFVNFLEFTAELYGDFVAKRPISISDFDPKEETALLNSRVQYLPFRDRSGRRVCVSVGTCNFDLDHDLRFKILIYLHWVISEDIETQRKGVVFVSWIFDEDETKSWETVLRPKMKQGARYFHVKHWVSVPIRLASLHHYYVQDTLFFKMLYNLYVYHIKEANIRKCFKRFFGDQTELLYKLSSFGVPADLMPVSCTGKVKTANHSAFCNVQRARQRLQNGRGSIAAEAIVECPRSEDVVFKKGPGYRNNPGNTYFRSLVEKYGDAHQLADKEEKYQITLRIVESIEEINGRFLEWSKPRKLWLVNTDRSQTRSKVASSIKQFNRQKRKEQQAKQLRESISNAEILGNDSENGDDVDTKREHSAEFTMYQDTKRRKLLSLCDSHTAGGEEDQFCFGRTFFPTLES
eukprot:CAMPEP_0197264794 /NCGR_PEP_ID=MMETSP1432-20130617/2004_1 /TAXON_ID=44447 /ORGANISM="Pseudo-nitzschia delicatissima, Strain UNC1205" /LENGTH=568 /DNA_ID=CAMNT_0042729467 /DNA_START=55 /DNA_END=1761 /DNA_ORIENTATION=+